MPKRLKWNSGWISNCPGRHRWGCMNIVLLFVMRSSAEIMGRRFDFELLLRVGHLIACLPFESFWRTWSVIKFRPVLDISSVVFLPMKRRNLQDFRSISRSWLRVEFPFSLLKNLNTTSRTVSSWDFSHWCMAGIASGRTTYAKFFLMYPISPASKQLSTILFSFEGVLETRESYLCPASLEIQRGSTVHFGKWIAACWSSLQYFYAHLDL